MSHSLDTHTVSSVINGLTSRSSPTIPPSSQNVQQSQENELAECSLSEDMPTNINEHQTPERAKLSTTRQTIVSLAAGASAGALAKTTIAPFDRTKIYFQVTNRKFSFGEAIAYLARSHKKNGFLSLWRGNSATMARIIPYSGIQFASHERYRKMLHADVTSDQISAARKFLAGSLAGVTSQAATYPLDLIRARMAVTPSKKFSSLTQVFVITCRKEGPLSLYKGITPTLVGVIPYAGTSFSIYGTLKQYHGNKNGDVLPNSFEKAAYGAVAGLCGQSASYPLDIVRRRMQTAQITGKAHAYQTIIGTLKYVYKHEGLVHGLYKGLSLNWVKGPLAVGISFSTFDSLKEFLEKYVET